MSQVVLHNVAPVMKRVVLLALCLAALPLAANPQPWADTSPHRDGFLTVNGVKLNYLDWGGAGPVLLLVAGLGENPHIFDDLAPGLTDRFRVIAYARRGHGLSEDKGPYDAATLIEDLRGVMDALGVAHATLVGWSMAGDEITAMAARYPARVDRLVYLDSLYDYTDPRGKVSATHFPSRFLEPATADLASLDAYQAFQGRTVFAGVSDLRRVEAAIRQDVVVQPDGSVKERVSQQVQEAIMASLRTSPRDYSRVHCPALAIIGATAIGRPFFSTAERRAVVTWERDYWRPLRSHDVARARRQLPGLRIVTVTGGHASFFLISRRQVLMALRQFMDATP